MLERARLHGGGEQEEQRVEVAERGRLALVADEADQLAEGERADELRQVVEQLEEAAVEEAAAEDPQQAPEEGRLPVGAPVAEFLIIYYYCCSINQIDMCRMAKLFWV